MRLILISGKAGSGKDFLTKHLKEYLEVNYNYKVGVIHYADPLKMVCTQLYDWDGNKGECGRTLLQQVGTNIAQQYNPLLWTDIINQIVAAFQNEFDVIIIPDTRFKHELIGTSEDMAERGIPCYTIRIYRDLDNGLTEEQKAHRSETDLDDFDNFDFEFDNEGTNLTKFFFQISEICNDIV